MSKDTTDPVDGSRRGPGRSVPLTAFVGAVFVAGLLGLLAVVALVVGGSDDADPSQARAVAGEYTERFLDLAHDDFDGWLQDMRSIGTAGFGESVGEREGELRALLLQTQVTWNGTVVDVFIAEEGDGVASAVVLFDLLVTDRDGPRTLPDQYLRMDLVEGSESWLVERVISITGGGTTIGVPTATTSPTAPVDSSTPSTEP